MMDDDANLIPASEMPVEQAAYLFCSILLVLAERAQASGFPITVSLRDAERILENHRWSLDHQRDGTLTFTIVKDDHGRTN